MKEQAAPPQVTVQIPPDFLTGPSSQPMTVRRVDWTENRLPKYKGLYAIVIDNIMTPDECSKMVSLAEQSIPNNGNGKAAVWERAMINVGGGRQSLRPESRNCGRIIWDNRDMVGRVWDRVKDLPEVQEIVRLEKVPKIFGNGPTMRDEVWAFSRPNDRMRFLKYVGGEYFRPHEDGSYETEDRSERSYFTMHLYLNGSTVDKDLAGLSQEERRKALSNALIGGATTFHDYMMEESYDVHPVPGRILLFQHRNLLHSGDDVLRGVKYTMRTDLMYKLESSNGKMGKSHVPVLKEFSKNDAQTPIAELEWAK